MDSIPTSNREAALAAFTEGTERIAADRLAEAIACFRRALALWPDFVEADANLGLLLGSLGQHAAALPHLATACRRLPANTVLGNAYGVALLAQGAAGEAVVCLQQVIAAAPQVAEPHNNLGKALLAMGRDAEAAQSFREAIRRDPQFAVAYYNLGNLLQDKGWLDEAETCYRAALAIRADYHEAHNNLGSCLLKASKIDAARAAFEAALASKPDFIEAHCNLAALKRYTVDDPQARPFLAFRDRADTLPVAGRIRYWFAAGKILEDQGRFDEAFAAYHCGNALKLGTLKVDEAAMAGVHDALCATQDAAFFQHRAPVEPADDGPVPVFIVGMPRSGTSLIEQVLASHPGVYGAGELTCLSDLIEAELGERALADPAAIPALAGWSPAQFHALGQHYLDAVRALAPTATHITDKLPANFMLVGLIHLMLPRAKIIHAIRDPMDSCFSCYSRLFARDNLPFTYDLGVLGRYCRRYLALMQHWDAVLPAGRVLALRYEDMVADLEGQARRMLAYLDLPWDAGCLDFHRNSRAVRTASAAQVNQPIYTSSVARWRHFETHLAPLQQSLGEAL
jgi:tetratricopeptide (TPR) repeat protein